MAAGDGASTIKDPEIDTDFSYKRYFINNVDSYHGEEILKQVSKVLEKNQQPPTMPSTTTRSSIAGEDQEPFIPLPPEKPYEIYATVSDPKIEKVPDVAKIIPKDNLLPHLLTCGYVVFDISYDPEQAKIAEEYLKVLKELLERQAEAMTPTLTPQSQTQGDNDGDTNRRYLILISSIMTWANTKPLDPETPDMPFVETDFRKRKPHVNYKYQYNLENEVIAIARNYRTLIGATVVCVGVTYDGKEDVLFYWFQKGWENEHFLPILDKGSNTVPFINVVASATVVCVGVTYGGKEDVLFYWFQKGWENEHFLPILDKGSNTVPLINVVDVAQIIYLLLSEFPRKLYILAVEQTTSKQRQIIKAIGRCLGTGLFRCIPKEDALLIPEITQRIYDLMTLDLPTEPAFITETLNIEWASELAFWENVPALAQLFKKGRILKPFKILVYGPPLVGKTTLAKRICENYGLVYISPETVIDDIIEDLERRTSHWAGGERALLPPGIEEEAASTVDEDEENEGREIAVANLAVLKTQRPTAIADIQPYIRQRMLFKDAQNRGWVLDGYPCSPDQCDALFERGDEADEAAEEEEKEDDFEEDLHLYDNVLKKLLPDIVVSLEATDEFICEKAMRQPEGDSRFFEDNVLRRLADFRALDARDVTPLNFFDELEIHPLVVKVKEHDDYSMEKPYFDVSLRMGKPCQYGKLIALTEAADNKIRMEYESMLAKQTKAREELEKRMQEEREEKMEYWSELYGLLREEEEQALGVASEPMRTYLMNYIFPALTPALLHLADIRPKDPVDYLAEYLFKQNPTGRMLEPGYNFQAEKLLGKIKILDDALNDLDIVIEPLLQNEDADLALFSSSSNRLF